MSRHVINVNGNTIHTQADVWTTMAGFFGFGAFSTPVGQLIGEPDSASTTNGQKKGRLDTSS